MDDEVELAAERDRFRYPLHFGVLTGLTVWVTAVTRWLPVHGPVARFGLYGALYSCSLAVAVRGTVPLRHRLEFIAGGALLSAVNVIAGIQASRMLSGLPGTIGPSLILASCAGLGAAGYAVLVRTVWHAALPPRALVSMALGCMLASLGILALHLTLRADGLWVAVSWWFAFSIGLWYHDGLRRAGRSGRPSGVDGG